MYGWRREQGTHSLLMLSSPRNPPNNIVSGQLFTGKLGPNYKAYWYVAPIRLLYEVNYVTTDSQLANFWVPIYMQLLSQVAAVFLVNSVQTLFSDEATEHMQKIFGLGT